MDGRTNQFTKKRFTFNPVAPFPILKLEAPHRPISDDVVQEIDRAAATTFRVLGVDSRKYHQGLKFEDLIDPWAKK